MHDKSEQMWLDFPEMLTLQDEMIRTRSGVTGTMYFDQSPSLMEASNLEFSEQYLQRKPQWAQNCSQPIFQVNISWGR